MTHNFGVVPLAAYTDKYFTKTRNCVADDDTATYGVFIRRDVICAINIALEFLAENSVGVQIERHYEEGQLVPAERPLFSYTGPFKELVELETRLLQRVGFSCVSAYNAYKMAMACPEIPFLDMHARHAAGTDMVIYSGYGAYVGSRAAQLSEKAAKGFIGTSVDITAKFYGGAGLGTMPHALIGYAGSTLKAVQLFIDKNPDDQVITALVDYYGKEVTDSLEVADWFDTYKVMSGGTKTLGVRLDTHGGRFMEGLDYEASVDVVGDWLHTHGEWPVVKRVMGEDAFEIASDAVRDRVRAMLFGKGVSAAAIIHMRNSLDRAGHKDVKITASSGFNLRKCRIMANVHAPIDMIGTGSFLPETLSETYATADIYAYNGEFSVKVGREGVFRPVYKK